VKYADEIAPATARSLPPGNGLTEWMDGLAWAKPSAVNARCLHPGGGRGAHVETVQCDVCAFGAWHVLVCTVPGGRSLVGVPSYSHTGNKGHLIIIISGTHNHNKRYS
jgi:hypothetical protein